MEKIRLQKYFTMCGEMSRRAAENEIAAGNVTVNGVVASLGDKIDPKCDTVRLGTKIIAPAQSGHTYIMLNKPMGYVTTMSDEKGRKCVSELVADCPARVYPVGRLDMYSEGLLIFTDDGELANRLMHPSHSFEKVYKVKVKGELSDESIKALTSPMELDGYALRPIKAEVIARGRKDLGGNVYSVLLITLHEGRNRQIRKMCEKCGITVMRLKRISVGPIELGSLESGKWRHLSAGEVSRLKSPDKED